MKVRIGVGTAGFAFDAARDFFAFAERCEAAGDQLLKPLR